MSKNKETNLNKANDCFDNDIFLALFRKGAHKYLENDLLGDLPDSDDTSRLSEICDKKIKNMIKQAIRKERNKLNIRRLPKIAAIILIVIAVFSTTIFSVEALRVRFLNMFIETQEEVTDITFEDSESQNEVLKNDNEPGYIPDGFKLTSIEEIDNRTTLFYTNNNGDTIDIDRYSTGNNIGIDTENAEYGNIKINGHDGFYSIKNGFATIVFKTDEYAFLVTGNIDISEIKKIAENLK